MTRTDYRAGRRLLRLAWALLIALLHAGVAPAPVRAATIQYDVASLGGNTFRYTYFLSELTLEIYQEVDIRFDPALFRDLSDPAAGLPGEFSVLALEPNNPPGAFGDYLALARVSHPTLSSGFHIDFIYLGTGLPAGQPYLINQFDADRKFVATIGSGFTSPAAGAVPEPGGAILSGIGLLICGASLIARRSKAAIAKAP